MKNTKAKVRAELIFIEVFDAAIQQVYPNLLASGLTDDEIWAAFRTATQCVSKMASEVEREQPPRLTLNMKVRRSRHRTMDLVS
jgi:hypothetical protein